MAAYRLPYLLAGDSVVLKQESTYYEHFYNELRPWEHYIPIRADLGDLLEKVQWARDHDEEVILTGSLDFIYTAKVLTCSVIKINQVAMFLVLLKVKKIARAGQQFARNYLMGDDIFCYYYKLFQVIIPKLVMYVELIQPYRVNKVCLLVQPNIE